MSDIVKFLLGVASFFLLIHLWIMYDLRKINKAYEHYRKTGDKKLSFMNYAKKLLSGIILDFLIFILFSSIFFSGRDLIYSLFSSFPLTAIFPIILFLSTYLFIRIFYSKNNQHFNFAYLNQNIVRLIVLISMPFLLLSYLWAPANIFKIVKRNFTGIYGIVEMDEDHHNKYPQYIFNNDDEQIKRSVNELTNINYEFDDESIHYDYFIFWQSSLAYGYNASKISGYYANEKSKQILRIGPLRFLESLILSIEMAILFLIIILPFRIFNRFIFFKDVKSLFYFLKNDLDKQKY